MDYKESLSYLDRFVNYERSSYYKYGKAYSLDNIRKLLSLLGNPQDGYFSIIVSGTKGKGSTATILSSILTAAGARTAKYSSPHLISVRERIQINEKPISRPEFQEAASLVRRATEKSGIKGLTYFEVLTTIAFLHFKNKNVDIAVLEVGLGGRLDATNTAPAKISVITPISLDHTHLLGDSLEKIALEKSGIIKEDSFVVSAPQHKQAAKVIREAVLQKRGKLFLVGKDLTYKNLNISFSGTSFDARTRFSLYKQLKVSLIGRHQCINTLTSLAVIEILNNNFAFEIKEPAIREALKHISFPGRFHMIRRRPYIILDGAQNKESALLLRETVERLFIDSKVTLILGISSDKDIEGIGSVICPIAERVIFTEASSERALSVPMLAQRLKRFSKSSYAAYDIEDAIRFARGFARKKDLILITGSLFLVGDALRLCRSKDYA
ncbi:MAG: folylpolyglutamate synthase/dihydrofolate synthase family protein [Candidatus Omnitrophota bacterium]